MNAQAETEDLLPAINFDYSKAKPNRFAHNVVNVILDEEIAKIFTTSEAVNKALRAILSALPETRKTGHI
jgi:hypothetical protein